MLSNRRSNRHAVRRRSRPRPLTLLTLKERRYLTFQHHHDALNLGCQFLYPDFTFIPLSPFPSPLLKDFCEPFSSPSNFFNRTPHQLNIFLSPSFNCLSHLVSLNFISLPNLTRSYNSNSSTLTVYIILTIIVFSTTMGLCYCIYYIFHF